MKWIEIKETEPKDGERIIAFTTNQQEPIMIGYWNKYENALCDSANGVIDWKWSFTHWIPLPQEPALKGA